MAFSAPAVSVNKFQGGFRSSADYTDLADTETNDAQNCEYNPDGDLKQRKGSLKLYNTRLTSSSQTAVRPITGHYYYDKLGLSGTFNIVMAGDSIYNYNTSTASVIRTGMNDNSETFWNTIQIQDPRSASDDVVLMTNGVDAIQLWNGSGSAILLSSLTSATAVPVCKYILQHENFVYAANISDSTSVDSPVQVKRSEIGSDGAPNPHRFIDDFFIGGSDKDGEIQGQKLLGELIFYYTKKSIWRFTPGLGDVNDLEKIVDNLGLLAPYSLVDVGDFHIFYPNEGYMLLTALPLFIFQGILMTSS